jgi:hypothetical protein
MVSQIVGLNRWGGPLAAYHALTGTPDATPRNAAMGRGLALEESVLAMLGEQNEHALVSPWVAGQVRATSLPHAHASLDAVMWRDVLMTVVDAKTASIHEMGEDWGLDGSDKIPAEYHLQLLWYIGVCKAAGMSVADEALLPTLCGPEVELQWAARLVTKVGRPLALEDLDGTGLELRVYRVAWDAALFEDVNARVVRFLREHVEPRVPPAPAAGDLLTERDMRAVSATRAEAGRVLDFERMDPAEQALVLELLEANRQRKAWEKAEEQAEARVKLAMGTAEEMRGLPGGARVAWKGSSDATGKRRFQVHEPRGRK